MKPNFQTITIKELKKYVLERREDLEAFQTLVDRIEQQPHKQLHDDVSFDRFSQLLQEHQKSQHS
jgi:hypothetical protein